MKFLSARRTRDEPFDENKLVRADVLEIPPLLILIVFNTIGLPLHVRIFQSHRLDIFLWVNASEMTQR